VPAPFECACHQAVVRLPTVLLALRPLGLVARVLSRQRQCLAGEVVFRAHPLECLHGGGAPSRLDGVQDGGGDGPIDAAAANRQTGGGATIDAPPMAAIPWHPARGAAIGHRELPSAASTASQATEHRRPPFGGAPGTTLRPVARGLQQLLGVQKVLPAAVPRVLVQQDHTPLRPRLFLAMALPRPPVDEHGLGGRAAIDQRPSIARIALHLMDALRTGPAPEARSAPGPRPHLRQRSLRLTIPAHGLPGPAQVPPLLADASDGVVPLASGTLCEPILPGADEPDGAFPQDMAALDFGFNGLARPLAHEAQRIFRHRALHPPIRTTLHVIE